MCTVTGKPVLKDEDWKLILFLKWLEELFPECSYRISFRHNRVLFLKMERQMLLQQKKESLLVWEEKETESLDLFQSQDVSWGFYRDPPDQHRSLQTKEFFWDEDASNASLAMEVSAGAPNLPISFGEIQKSDRLALPSARSVSRDEGTLASIQRNFRDDFSTPPSARIGEGRPSASRRESRAREPFTLESKSSEVSDGDSSNEDDDMFAESSGGETDDDSRSSVAETPDKDDKSSKTPKVDPRYNKGRGGFVDRDVTKEKKIIMAEAKARAIRRERISGRRLSKMQQSLKHSDKFLRFRNPHMLQNPTGLAEYLTASGMWSLADVDDLEVASSKLLSFRPTENELSAANAVQTVYNVAVIGAPTSAEDTPELKQISEEVASLGDIALAAPVTQSLPSQWTCAKCQQYQDEEHVGTRIYGTCHGYMHCTLAWLMRWNKETSFRVLWDRGVPIHTLFPGELVHTWSAQLAHAISHNNWMQVQQWVRAIPLQSGSVSPSGRLVVNASKLVMCATLFRLN